MTQLIVEDQMIYKNFLKNNFDNSKYKTDTKNTCTHAQTRMKLEADLK